VSLPSNLFPRGTFRGGDLRMEGRRSGAEGGTGSGRGDGFKGGDHGISTLIVGGGPTGRWS
jgi:hypothetical protein